MDLCKKMDLRKIKCWIVNKYKLLLACGIFTIIELILMTNALVEIKTESDNMSLAVQKWYDQLPEEHWIKSEENKYFNQKYFKYQLIDVYEQLKNESYTLTKLSYVVMDQEEKVGKIFAKAMETADSCNERKFCLKNSESKSIKKISDKS